MAQTTAYLLSAALCAALLAGCGASEKEMIASAQAYLDKGDTKSAMIQLKSALQKDGQNAQARWMLGSALLSGGDPVAAAVEFRKARELKYDDNKVAPPLAQALLVQNQPRKVIDEFAELTLPDADALANVKTTLASAYAAQGDMDRAREALKAAQQAVPGYPPALLVTARLKASENDADGALFLLDDILAKDAKNEAAWLLKGDLLAYAKNDPKAAAEAWRAALAQRPRMLAAHKSLIDTYLHQGDVAAAKAQLAELQKVHPNHVDTKFFEAQLAFLANDFKAAREITEQIMKVQPDNALVLQLAGAAEYRMNSVLAAENYFSRALKINGNLSLSRQLLAQVYIRSGQPAKAVDLLAPLIGGDNADPRLLALAGEAALQAGDTKRSEELYARAAKANPSDPKVRAALALNQLGRGNDKAMAELEKMSAADTSSRSTLALISARLQRNDLDGALKAIDELQKKVPDKPLAYHLRGRVQLLKKDFPAATASFEKALRLDPLYFGSAASLAALDLQAGKPDQAKKRFDDMLKVDPKNYQALLALADLKQRSGGSKDEVTAIVTQAIKLNPSEPAPRLLLVNHLLARSDVKAALNAAQDGAAALPNDFDLMDALGRAQVASGDSQQGVSTFKKMAALQPTRPSVQMRLAEAYASLRDKDGAAAAYKRALELQPDLLPAQRALVALALDDRKPLDALTIARQVQKQRPTEPAGWLLEGDAEGSRKNWDGAIAAYRSSLQKKKGADGAIKLHLALAAAGKQPEADKFAASWTAENPKDAVFLFHLGDQVLAKGDFAGAESRYRDVLKVQPNNALALNNVAWLLVKQNKPGAVEAAEKANALLPDRAPLMDTLALALLASNQGPKALEVQKKAIERAPEDPSLRLGLARIYLKTGDKAAARIELERLSKLGSRFSGQSEVTELLKSV
jgi:cellulose synthase operon protein C